ncbi:uncharacterized protein LOC117591253 [Drosophila guanche]|uniref:uncharacterized protein LOC117591252 n=1 Tax=Drosophila guanche TaxID=7266 RepID=UPI001471107E|nr:uncharacterized protein LOC117591252 [Drosophila guanche]XP_034140329.1 uncharacterized protein LOC117591253 [Drosophila guanche]
MCVPSCSRQLRKQRKCESESAAECGLPVPSHDAGLCHDVLVADVVCGSEKAEGSQAEVPMPHEALSSVLSPKPLVGELNSSTTSSSSSNLKADSEDVFLIFNSCLHGCYSYRCCCWCCYCWNVHLMGNMNAQLTKRCCWWLLLLLLRLL